MFSKLKSIVKGVACEDWETCRGFAGKCGRCAACCIALRSVLPLGEPTFAKFHLYPTEFRQNVMIFSLIVNRHYRLQIPKQIKRRIIKELAILYNPINCDSHKGRCGIEWCKTASDEQCVRKYCQQHCYLQYCLVHGGKKEACRGNCKRDYNTKCSFLMCQLCCSTEGNGGVLGQPCKACVSLCTDKDATCCMKYDAGCSNRRCPFHCRSLICLIHGDPGNMHHKNLIPSYIFSCSDICHGCEGRPKHKDCEFHKCGICCKKSSTCSFHMYCCKMDMCEVLREGDDCNFCTHHCPKKFAFCVVHTEDPNVCHNPFCQRKKDPMCILEMCTLCCKNQIENRCGFHGRQCFVCSEQKSMRWG